MGEKKAHALHDAFGDMDEQALEEMTRKSAWFNPNLITDKEIDDILYEMAEKSEGRAIDMSSLGGGDNTIKKTKKGKTAAEDDADMDEEFEGLDSTLLSDAKARRTELKQETGRFHVYPTMDIPLLYTEFARCLTEKKFLTTEVLHKIPRHSADHKALCTWNRYKELVSPFLGPVNHAIQTGCTQITTIGNTQQQKLSKKSLFQNALAQSRYRHDKLNSQEVMAHVESALDLMTMRIIGYKDMLFFLFEWVEVQPFAFAMAFRTQFIETQLTNQLQYTAVILYRKDVWDYDEKEAAHRESKTKDSVVSSNFLMESSKADDEEDAMAFRHDATQALPTRYISSVDSENECFLVRRLKLALHSATISYIGSGYVKRA